MESPWLAVIQSLPKGIKWTDRYSSDNVLSQIATLRNVDTHRKKIVHPNNAGPHAAKCVKEYMDHNSLKSAPHPPDSPDLAPSDFYLFGYVNHQFQGHEYTEGAKLVSGISEIVNQIPTDTLVDVFDDWMRRLQRYNDISGEYVE
jgi:hypothetical protein